MSPQSISDDYGGGDARGHEDYSVSSSTLSVFCVPGGRVTGASERRTQGCQEDHGGGVRWERGYKRRVHKKGLGEQAQLPRSIFATDLNGFRII